VHQLAHSTLAYIRKHALIRPGDRVGVAVSGGADSVGLLRILLELKPELGIVLFVVHFNHNLRGAESAGDEQFVGQLAGDHRLGCICEDLDVKTHAAERKLSLEAAARELRYELFERLLTSGDLTKIATAHTLDDQAETVLLKLARGAGTRGLAGIYPKISIQHSALSSQEKCIVRPLLATRRTDIEKYLREVNQSWREDSSNRDLRHTRNRVRHGILPRLEAHVNPAVREALADAAEIARAEEEYWANELERLLPQVWNEKHCSLDCRGLLRQPLAVQRRLVRAAAERAGLVLELRHIGELLSLEPGSQASLPGNWKAKRKSGQLEFCRPSQDPTEYEYNLPVPGRVPVPQAGIVLETMVAGSNSGQRGYNPEHLLDAKTAQRGLVARNWRAGERFWPAHTRQPRKIKDLLQDRQITGEDKKHWPVVASGDEVVWLRGFGVRRDFVAKDGTGVLIREIPMQ